MGIARINPYSQRLIGLSKEAKPELLKAKNLPSDEKVMEKWKSEQEKLKKAAEQMKAMRAQMKQAEESAKAEQDELKALITCMEISRRIISGDKVPPKDHQYLMEHDMGLYARSIMLRRFKEDPYEYDQLSEDEKSKSPQSVAGGEISSGAEISDSSEGSVPTPSLDVSI
ncbi:MAG TPA: hypothetical protein PKA19_14405 [Bacillota bacterium]|nr:hypothetical protein [Bacillota bacterium]